MHCLTLRDVFGMFTVNKLTTMVFQHIFSAHLPISALNCIAHCNEDTSCVGHIRAVKPFHILSILSLFFYVLYSCCTQLLLYHVLNVCLSLKQIKRDFECVMAVTKDGLNI